MAYENDRQMENKTGGIIVKYATCAVCMQSFTGYFYCCFSAFFGSFNAIMDVYRYVLSFLCLNFLRLSGYCSFYDYL